MHREKSEDCTITYTNGDTYKHKFSDNAGCEELRSQIALIIKDVENSQEEYSCSDLMNIVIKKLRQLLTD